MILLVGALFGLSLVKYVEYLLGRILRAGKVSLEGKIVVLALGDINRASQGTSLLPILKNIGLVEG